MRWHTLGRRARAFPAPGRKAAKGIYAPCAAGGGEADNQAVGRRPRATGEGRSRGIGAGGVFPPVSHHRTERARSRAVRGRQRIRAIR